MKNKQAKRKFTMYIKKQLGCSIQQANKIAKCIRNNDWHSFSQDDGDPSIDPALYTLDQEPCSCGCGSHAWSDFYFSSPKGTIQPATAYKAWQTKSFIITKKES